MNNWLVDPSISLGTILTPFSFKSALLLLHLFVPISCPSFESISSFKPLIRSNKATKTESPRMEDFNRMPPIIGAGTSSIGLPLPQTGLISPPSANDTPQGWNQSGFPRRESAATVESASTMVDSNYSGASSSKEGKEHLFMGDDGPSGSGDGKRHQTGGEELLEGGGGGGEENDVDDTRTMLSMRAERVGGVSTFKTIAGIV